MKVSIFNIFDVVKRFNTVSSAIRDLKRCHNALVSDPQVVGAINSNPLLKPLADKMSEDWRTIEEALK